ncbi:MAG: ATPase [Caldithrix sp. RBG_13_44_9]|nr:MAG: ATPase [Caldithrix sp. RBG_13_44_9]
MKKSIRIAAGQGFWGDRFDAPIDQIRRGPVDYLVMDYLAEVTMSIMQKQKMRDPKQGYARDIISLMKEILPDLVKNNVKVITNAGGVNPLACRNALFEIAQRLGIKGLKIGIVYGDDIIPQIAHFIASGITLNHMESGEPLQKVRERLYSANIYFGARPVVEALQKEAQIIITGRVTDTGLTLAPMIYEFGWSEQDYNQLAAGIVAGHIIECGAQVSGGNFLAGWKEVPDMAHIGFPIIEAYPSGEFVVTKHDQTGGMVDLRTVKEQLLYELGNPKEYITPDVVADFTSIQLRLEGKDRVRVSGVHGRKPTPFFKVSISYADGWISLGKLTYAWPDALEKAKKADEIIRQRIKDLKLKFDEIHTEFLGINACHGPLSHPVSEPNEVVLQIGVRGSNLIHIEQFSREMIPLVLCGPPTVTGFGSGRSRPKEVVAFWPALIPKEAVKAVVDVQ